jgi:hypothetical protein
MHSTIDSEPALAELIATFARASRASPDLNLLEHSVAGVEVALDHFERSLALSLPDLPDRAREAYLAALRLAGVLSRVSVTEPGTRAKVERFMATAHRMLLVLGPLVAATDRMLAARLLDGDLSCLH